MGAEAFAGLGDMYVADPHCGATFSVEGRPSPVMCAMPWPSTPWTISRREYRYRFVMLHTELGFLRGV